MAGTEKQRIRFSNSGLQLYKGCPKRYYYKYKRGWVRDYEEKKSLPLVFGSAWGAAMDAVWQAETQVDAVREGQDAFWESWLGEGLPEGEELLLVESEMAPRTPTTGMEMVSNYVEQRWAWLCDQEVIGIEEEFTVRFGNIEGEEIDYIGIFDKVVRNPVGKIEIIDHKTTSGYAGKRGERKRFKPAFLDGFSPDTQMEGYAYLAYEKYGDEFGMIQIDGALVHNQAHDVFQLIPIYPSKEMADVWAEEAEAWIRIILNRELDGYPKNTGSCWAFNSRCAYHEICKYEPKPEGLIEPPPGFIVRERDAR